MAEASRGERRDLAQPPHAHHLEPQPHLPPPKRFFLKKRRISGRRSSLVVLVMVVVVVRDGVGRDRSLEAHVGPPPDVGQLLREHRRASHLWSLGS